MNDNQIDRAGKSQWEPNPATRRRLTERFFDERTAYNEDCVAFARGVEGTGCILPTGLPAAQTRPRLAPGGVLVVPVIRALGVHGHRIVAGFNGHDAIPDLDTRWPVGRYEIYACLAWDKVPFGDIEEELDGPDGEPWFHAPRYRRPQVVLETNERRMGHRDWLQVAVLHRERDRGEVASYLDPLFHPFPVSMSAYGLPNPLVQLTVDAFDALASVPDPSKDIRDTIRVLRRLRNLAEAGTPEPLFLLTQEVVGKLRSLELDPPPLVLDGRIEDHAYEPATFCEFLSTVADSLRKARTEVFPKTMSIDGDTFTLLPGEFLLDEEVWTWSPPYDGFAANQFAIYLPRVTTAEVPHFRYSHQPHAMGRFELAGYASRISHSGCAAVLDKLPQQCGRIHVIADADSKRVRLLQILGEGHALYYK